MIRSSRFVLGLALVASILVLPTKASADQIGFLGVGHSSVVSVGGIRSGNFWAGEVNWRWIGATPEGFAESFYAYCADISQNLASPQTVTVTTTEGFTNGVADGGARAAWLVNQYAGGIREMASGATANIMAAALQVAIWETMYDSSTSLSGGNFQLTGGSLGSAIATQAEIYLAALYNASGAAYNTSVATLLDVAPGARGQDQLVARVSEPSTLLLLGLAFLMFARRARRTAASPAA